MKHHLGILCLLLCVLAGCAAPKPAPGTPAASTNPALQQLQDQTFLFEVLRYVYLWYFDEAYFLAPGQQKTIEIWTRLLHRDLDEGDRSQYAEIWLPSIRMLLELKWADYEVPEMKLVAKDNGFKIQAAERVPRPAARKTAYNVLRFDRETLHDYLFQTRTNRLFPGEALRKNCRVAVIKYLNRHYPDPFTDPQVIYTASIAPVSNELWVFWENDRKLLRFSADMDLSNPAFWNLTPMTLHVFDLYEDVVVSPEEIPGSNAYVTKDWIGRVLFNCIVLGKKQTVPAEEINRLKAEAQAQEQAPAPR